MIILQISDSNNKTEISDNKKELLLKAFKF